MVRASKPKTAAERAEKRGDSYTHGLIERDPSDRYITMSNGLTRAGHGLTLSEKRLIGLAVSKIDSKMATPKELVYTIHASEYAAQWDMDDHTAYEALQDAAKNLYNRSITYFKQYSQRKGASLTTVKLRWVYKIEYNKGMGTVTLGFSPDVLPHLTNLKKQFTSYKLGQTNALRSMFSWRLLELLERFKSSGWAEYAIEDFCEAMNATEKQRADFNNIRRRIIEPAVKELVEKDGWLIEWEPVKAGRKVAKVRFKFERDPQLKLL